MQQPQLELSPAEVAEVNAKMTDEVLSATQIQALVRAMDQSKKKWRYLRQRNRMDEYKAALKRENETLFFNYPSLFEMHAEDRLDSTFFEMLQLKRKIERGEMTSEQASQVIGQQLFTRYVPHRIDSNAPPPAPKMSYEDYYKQTGGT
jgi:dephospho-CoA kinase